MENGFDRTSDTGDDNKSVFADLKSKENKREQVIFPEHPSLIVQKMNRFRIAGDYIRKKHSDMKLIFQTDLSRKTV
jgi:hypothetical protein